jgi:hypothetical protein
MLSNSSVSSEAGSRAAAAASFSSPPSYEPISVVEGRGSGGLGVGSGWEDEVVEAIVSVGDFGLDSEGFTGAVFDLAVWLRVEEGCFLTVVAVLFVGTNLGFWDLLRDVVEVTFLTGG